MEESRMKKHVTVVGAIQIGFSILWLIGAVVLFFVFNIAKDVIPAEGDVPDFVFKILDILGVLLPVFLATVACFGLVGGIALLSYKGWGRILTIIVAALGCFNIPIGTLIGVYSIWVLMQDDTVKLFQKG